MSELTERRAQAGEMRSITAEVRWTPDKRGADSRTIKGYAAVFDSESEDIGFRETLARGCFRRALDKTGSDQFLLWQHDDSAILARRSAGTLKLEEDSRGLRFRAELANTTLGNDVLELVRTGHVNQMSFGFTMPRDGSGEEWTRRDGEAHRRVTRVDELLEVSLVGRPAYSATEAGARKAGEPVEFREDKPMSSKAAKRLTVREPDPYGEGSPHSFFRDLSVVGLAQERAQHAPLTNSAMRAAFVEDPNPPGPNTPKPEEAVQRLRSVRGLGLTAGAGGEFVPANLPPVLADEFQTAARARAVLGSVLKVEPMPADAGTSLRVPQFATGASVGVQTTDGATVTHGDFTTANASTSPALLAGYCDVSQQLVDLAAGGSFDRYIAAELGAAYGTQFDTQIINGSGSSGETTGILNTSSIGSVTYTDSSPVAGKVAHYTEQARATVANTYGVPADLILMRPERQSWIFGALDSNNRPLGWQPLAQIVETPALPVVSSQDPIIVLASEAVDIYAAEPSVRAMADVKSGTLQVRFVVNGWVACLVKRASAVCKVSGTGLANPLTW